MDSVDQLALHRGRGHDFSNHARNVRLLLSAAQQSAAAGVAATEAGEAAANPLSAGKERNTTIGSATAELFCGSPTANFVIPPLRKTGTTICGVVCNGGVVLGADTRATEGPIIADKDCSKLHRIADNMYAAGAGTAADLDHMCDWLAVQVELHRLNTNAEPRISMAVCVMSQELFKYQGYKVCALVLGGVDVDGPRIYKIHPHGSTDCANFAAMGSGSLNAMAVLEAGYRDNMSLEDGVELVSAAIKAGILNDLASGGCVDVVVITREEKAKHTRHYLSPVPPAASSLSSSSSGDAAATTLQRPRFPRGTTPVLAEKMEELKSRLQVVSQEVEMAEAAS